MLLYIVCMYKIHTYIHTYIHTSIPLKSYFKGFCLGIFNISPKPKIVNTLKGLTVNICIKP